MAKRIEFELPEGLSPPDDISKSGEFEALATIKIKKDGKSACLVALDGYRMKGYQENDEPDKDDGKSYAQAASDGMEGGY